MPETITLEFLAAQQRPILDEIALMRDDIKVLTTIVLSHDTLITMLEQMIAMVAQTRMRALSIARDHSTNG